MEILKILTASIVIATLAGCTKEFEPDLNQPPVLCLNSMITPGEPATATLTRTWRYSEGYAHNVKDLTVKDGAVALMVNGEHKADMVYDDNTSQYRSDYRPAPGDIITLLASSPRYGEATATITVPSPVKITATEIDAHLTADTYGDGETSGITVYGSIDVAISLDDPAGIRNFYQVEWVQPADDEWFDDIVFFPGTLQYDAEPLFSEHISALEAVFGSDAFGFTVFSDRSFDGDTRVLRLIFDSARISCKGIPDAAELEAKSCLTLSLRNMTESLYNWYIRDWQDTDGIVGTLSGIGLAETICGYSNVSTRAGIVAAYASSTIEINLFPYITFPENKSVTLQN